MSGMITLSRRIIKTLRGQVAAIKTNLNLRVRLACDLLAGKIIEILIMIFGQKHFLDRLSTKHEQTAELANVELYEAFMYPDDKKELVSIIYDVHNDIWMLEAKPTGKQLGRLINREDRVLLLCPRKLVAVLDKGRHGASMISVEDAYGKWQTKHVLMNRLSDPGQKDALGSMPDFGKFVQGEEGQDLRLSSHDIFHIRNLKDFLLHCSKEDNSAPTTAGNILKSWMVTVPQILSILEDKTAMRKCKRAYWELVRWGRVGSTVYLQLHGAGDPDESSQTLVHRETPVHTADTRTIAALRLSTQAVNNGSMSVPDDRSGHERVWATTGSAQAASDQAFADQTGHPYGKDLNINDPQIYFEKFGSLTSPHQTANILMALSFFLRPPELNWENLPLAEAEPNKTLLRSRNNTPEVFIASRKPDSLMAPLSQVTRIATSAVQKQFETSCNNDEGGQAFRSRWQTASNDETDLFQSPIYHQRQASGFELPVYVPQGPGDGASEQGSTATNSTTTTPKAGIPSRFASTETNGTVRVCKQPENGETSTGNGTILNPEAPLFTSRAMPSKGVPKTEEKVGLSVPAGAWPSINLDVARSVGILGYQKSEVHSQSGYMPMKAGPSLDGEFEASRENTESSSASADQSDTDVDQGGAELTEV